MSRHLLMNESAEREANDVAFRFMNSSDVIGDMKRAYSGRLDRVRIHDDASADAKVSAAGRDGIASGEDIYLKQGLLSDHSPETNGLIAHEMAHTMQQSEGAGMTQSVSYGAEQGGIRDWFRKRKEKKAEQEREAKMIEEMGDINSLEISGPNYDPTSKDRSYAMMGGKKVYLSGDGSYNYNQKNYSARSLELAYDMEKATPEQLTSPEMQARAQEGFIEAFTPQFQEATAKGQDLSFLFRDNHTGALDNFTRIMKALEPGDLAQSAVGDLTRDEELAIIQADMDHKEYKQAADHRNLGLDWKDEEQKAHYERGDVAAHARTGGILDKYSQAVEGTNGEGSALGNYMLGVQKAFTDAGIDEDTFSASMMNLQALRGSATSKIAMTKSLLSREDDPRLAQGSIRAKLGQAVQRKANEVYGDKAQHKSNPWASTLSRLLRKKRSQQSAGTGRSRSGTIFDSSAVLQ